MAGDGPSARRNGRGAVARLGVGLLLVVPGRLCTPDVHRSAGSVSGQQAWTSALPDPSAPPGRPRASQPSELRPDAGLARRRSSRRRSRRLPPTKELLRETYLADHSSTAAGGSPRSTTTALPAACPSSNGWRRRSSGGKSRSRAGPHPTHRRRHRGHEARREEHQAARLPVPQLRELSAPPPVRCGRHGNSDASHEYGPANHASGRSTAIVSDETHLQAD